jgi:hypothetical protein
MLLAPVSVAVAALATMNDPGPVIWPPKMLFPALAAIARAWDPRTTLPLPSSEPMD